ncbi:MAG: VWA domain-containing protein [Acidimicrobiales bacterium]
MLSIGIITAGDGHEYLTREVTSGVEDYYMRGGVDGGEAQGWWLGSQREAFGVTGPVVSEEQMKGFFGAKCDPVSGEALWAAGERGGHREEEVLAAHVQAARERWDRVERGIVRAGERKSVAGYDLTFLAPPHLSRCRCCGRPLRIGPPGTRIGRALKEFNDGYGRRGVARGAVVVVVSDGWERSDTDAIAREMARLSRLAHKIVWVNPRKAAFGYTPLAGGMAAALPYVDRFVSGHNLAAFDEVLEAVRSAR